MIPADLKFEVNFAAIWFVIGPILVYKFMKSFIELKDRMDFSPPLRKWFRDNEERHYKIYKRCMRIISPVVLALGVSILLYQPKILSEIAGISTGYNDPFYWVIIIFLSWLLVYATNAMAVIALMLTVIYRIKKYNILDYSPIDISHRTSFKELNKLCNKVVAYMCSGMFFLPLAFFFLWRMTYTEWVSSLLLFYGIFLLSAITYPKLVIRAHVNERSRDFLLKEKLQYFNSIKADRLAIFNKNSIIPQLRYYNSYLFIQELKTICSIKLKIDINTAITYLSIAITIFAAIPGFLSWIIK